jgi:hypothetical protein
LFVTVSLIYEQRRKEKQGSGPCCCVQFFLFPRILACFLPMHWSSAALLSAVFHAVLALVLVGLPQVLASGFASAFICCQALDISGTRLCSTQWCCFWDTSLQFPITPLSRAFQLACLHHVSCHPSSLFYSDFHIHTHRLLTLLHVHASPL